MSDEDLEEIRDEDSLYTLEEEDDETSEAIHSYIG